MNDTRTRILETSTQLFRRYGYPGTGLKQIAAESAAPFGSIYHFFPGGKEQLAGEVIRAAGPWYGALAYAFLSPSPELPTLPAALTAMFNAAASTLEETDYADACPIATVALEVASSSEPLRQATADVFTDWITEGTRLIAGWGLSEADARALTISVISALEGAFVLSRSLRSTEPVRTAGAGVAALAGTFPAG